MDWIIENKEWLFGGVLVAVPLALLGLFVSNKKNKQVQKSGDSSTNIQVGGSLNIRNKNDDE
ncbi:hypothetical protein [Psychrobacter sp. UBA3480]|uniref:hypothetical protein n=1 Tax=Psychrobacter sp. UBA3480 TaxID=1947350 RepID=UPI0025F2065D|nr:hypothetical protein [Psychrobacter sp. UBA3480]